MGDDRKIEGAVDLISNLPDELLHHILYYIPTKLSISTSILSRRWRHVWCEVPCLSLDVDTQTTADSVSETLTRYTASKTKSFHLAITTCIAAGNIPHIDRLIKFAMSDNVENLSLDFSRYYYERRLPDFFYNTCSVKQLNIDLRLSHMFLPEYCTVSWTSLQKLSLSCCNLFDKSLAKILSGCPILENLTLDQCGELIVLDLSKLLRLRILQVIRKLIVQGPKQIVAPHIHCLKLHDSQPLSCTLVNIASLTEANLEISFVDRQFKADFLQVKVLKMLDKFQNVEKLTLGRDFIQILSLAEIRGVSFPILKVKALTLDTKICQYVIPGIERLLQNSPGLEKLTVCGRAGFHMPVEFLDIYLKQQGFNVNICWRSKDGASWNEDCMEAKLKLVTSFVELVVENTEKLDKMVILLDERYLKFEIEDLVATLPHNNNVTIVLDLFHQTNR